MTLGKFDMHMMIKRSQSILPLPTKINSEWVIDLMYIVKLNNYLKDNFGYIIFGFSLGKKITSKILNHNP